MKVANQDYSAQLIADAERRTAEKIADYIQIWHQDEVKLHGNRKEVLADLEESIRRGEWRE